MQFPLEYPGDVEVTPLMLKIFFLQVELKFQVVFENAKVALFPNFKVGRRKDIPEERQLKPNVLIQVGQYDIDHDGIGELFICVQDFQQNVGGASLEVKVFKYYPPAYRQHTFRACNWELIGDFIFEHISGEPKAFVADSSIKVPRNLRGYFYRWTFSEGKFRNTSE